MTTQPNEIWLSWSDRAGYGYWDTRDEAELHSAIDFEPVRFVQAASEADPWHDAILAECMRIEGAYQKDDSVKTVASLIDWHVKNASEADYEEVLADHRRLVRELDVALNGDGAAEQASLVDIVAQVKDKRWKLVGASEAGAVPVGYFINDSAQGMKPHYSQIDEQFKGNDDVFPLYRFASSAQHPDDIAVDKFAAAMKQKLAHARKKGRDGWQHESGAYLSESLREHVDKGDPRDVANFCMFLWNLGMPICPSPSAPAAEPEKQVAQLDAMVDKAWDRFQQAIAPTDEELEEAAAEFADEMGRIHDDSHVEFARKLLERFAKRALFAAPAAESAEPEWIDDPHDIEQGMMRNPKYVPPTAATADAQGDERELKRWDQASDEVRRAMFVSALSRQPSATADPTDPGHDVGILREHVRHLERRVRQLSQPSATASVGDVLTAGKLREPKNGDGWRVEWWNESARMLLPDDKRLDSFQSYKNGTLVFTIKDARAALAAAKPEGEQHGE